MKKFQKFSFFVVSWFAIISLIGCQATDNGADTADTYQGEPRIVTDHAGNEVELPQEINSIASLAPSITEMLLGLELQDYITVADINAAYLVSDDILAIDLFNIDVESLIAAEPDLVLIAFLPFGDNPFDALTELGIPVIYLPASESIAGIKEDIAFLGDITNRSDEAEALVAQMQAELEDIRAQVPTSDEALTVYFEISPAPDMFSFGSGTLQNEMLELIGARNVFSDEEGWFPVESESIVTLDPDVIFTNASFMPDPVSEILERSGWEGMSAISNERVYYIPEDASSRASQNITKALQVMLNYLHGE